MKIVPTILFAILALASLGLGAALHRPARSGAGQAEGAALDSSVARFLNEHKDSWHDMNVSEADGRVLYDLILKHGYTRALEIGTSTGHSGIWIAWALSKTGGKLLTVEIDQERHDQAVENFRQAGLAAFIDARLADAHELVPRLPGPFDFVFCDADKDWYTQYLKDTWLKIEAGGCFAAHNTLSRMFGIQQFLDYARGRSDGLTTIDRTSGSGISITLKQTRKLP